MHGHNINLPVCVCVRHTFCQLAYVIVRPLNGCFDSLKYTDLRKDAPFGPKSPKTPILGPENMRKIQIFRSVY